MKFDAFLKAVGVKLREARWAADKTQEEIAAKVLTFRLLAELERGRGNPTLRTLFELARELDVYVHELVDVEPEKPGRVPLKDRKGTPPRRGRKPKPRRAAKKTKA